MATQFPDSEPDDAKHKEAGFVQLFIQHERGLRSYLRSMGLSWADADDVVQTVSLIAWKKWDQFEKGTSFGAWLRVIARFEALKFRRSMARDRHTFHGDLMELLADVAEESESTVSPESYRSALRICMETLPDKSRILIDAAYEGERTIKDVAGSVGKSATAVYKALNRIRIQLAGCIEERLQQEREAR